MSRRVTIFVNGNHLTFDYAEAVEANLVAWIQTMMDNPESKMTWVSEGVGSSDPIKVVLKASQVDGYYLRDTPAPTPEISPSQDKMLNMLQKMVDPDDEEPWKKS